MKKYISVSLIALILFIGFHHGALAIGDCEEGCGDDHQDQQQETPPSGGGGGGSPVITILPAAYMTPLDFIINDGSGTTNNPNLLITFNATTLTTKGYVISLNSSELSQQAISNYTPTTHLLLPDVPGTYTVYVQYYSVSGNYSEIISHTIAYKTGSVAGKFRFTRYLWPDMEGEDVRQLQIFLNKHGFPVALEGPGSAGQETTYFGPLTKAALIKFQEAHFSQILEPLNLDAGTGIFHVMSLTFANATLDAEEKQQISL